MLAWVIPPCATSAPQSSLTREKRLCLSTAAQAASICLSAPRVCALTKLDASPVSAADVAIQATVTRELRSAFPLDDLIAEEDSEIVLADRDLAMAAQKLVRFDISGVLQTSYEFGHERCWTLDPIDGTKGFLSGSGYAVGLALLGNSQDQGTDGPALAALTLPHEGMTLLAEPGRRELKAYVMEGRLDDELGDTSFSTQVALVNEQGGAGNAPMERVWHLSGARDIRLAGRPPWTPLCCGSLVKYAAVARQQAFAFVQVLSGRSAQLWDHAAGVGCVLAAGGRVTDEMGGSISMRWGQDGDELQLRGKAQAIVATATGVDHEAFCHELRQGGLS